jgi:hypothetical protein
MFLEIQKVIPISERPYADQTRYAYDGSGNPLYAGAAPFGAVTSDPVWEIEKYVWSGGNIAATLHAYGAWDDYLTLTYQ